MITGDKTFGPGHERYELQKSAVEELAVIYWGRGSVWPVLPTGHFDIVTVQDPFWRGLFAWYLARRLGAKFNVQVHMDLIAAKKSLRVATFVLRRADSVRVVTEKIKRQVEGLGVRTKITVLPVYVDASRFSSPPLQPHSGKNILWVGRFEEEKDPLAAVDVFKQVLKDIPDARLTMLGKGSLEGTLCAHAKGLPIESPGWQDPAAYLPAADVLLVTSYFEGFGAQMVEALAAGVPVVAPDVGAAREAGAIVAAREKLAQAVIETLRSGVRGQLKLKLLPKDEWARAWRASLQ